MTVATASTGCLVQDWVDALARQAPAAGPSWLNQIRRTAATALRRNGLPGNKDEAWKYTSLRRLESLAPAMGEPSAVDSGVWQALFPEPAGFGFQVLGGRLEWLDAHPPAGVSMQTLAEALGPAGDPLLQPRLRQMLESVEVEGRSRAFEALNSASLSRAIVIHVAAGQDAGTCLARWGFATSDVPRIINVRVLLVLEPGARLRLLEQYRAVEATPRETVVKVGLQPGQALNLLLQADLGADATLQHIRVQKAPQESILLTFNRVRQAQRSAYDYTGLDLGGGLVRHDVACALQGADASSAINGAFLLDGECHVDNHIRVDHFAPGGSSEQFFRGTLAGRSRGVFNGKAVIHPGADGSRVRQSNANLLLSAEAEIDTKPELEIHADEVEARHGATVGQMDELAVFYLRSRGLAEDQARRLLTGAFCRAVTSRMADTVLAGHLAELLDQALSLADQTDSNAMDDTQ